MKTHEKIEEVLESFMNRNEDSNKYETNLCPNTISVRLVKLCNLHIVSGSLPDEEDDKILPIALESVFMKYGDDCEQDKAFNDDLGKVYDFLQSFLSKDI